MAETPKLKSCPFCTDPMTTGNLGWFTHAAETGTCPIGYETFPPADVEAWNTRTQTDQQLREEVERLRRALKKIANYKWPVSAGEFTETFYGEATGAEYKLKHHIPKEMASGALESVKRIARSSLSSSSLTK